MIRREENAPNPSSGWHLPTVALLDAAAADEHVSDTITKDWQNLEKVLASYGIPARVRSVHVGARFCRFDLEPGSVLTHKRVPLYDVDGDTFTDSEINGKTHIKVGESRLRIAKLRAIQQDIASSLGVQEIHISTIPGVGLLGIEVPLSLIRPVQLRTIIESRDFQEIKRRGGLPLALGEDTIGEPISIDLQQLPHLLIAGTTGSGKSICLTSMLAGLAMVWTPDRLKFLFVDPKKVELARFAKLPHAIMPLVVGYKEAGEALRSVLKLMVHRFDRFAVEGVRDIDTFNLKNQEIFPYLIVVVEELGELMMSSSKETELTLIRLAQVGRAAGVHLILATQSPVPEVVHRILKANIPARVTFTLTSQAESRLMLDSRGAERLLGKGDMLFTMPGRYDPTRVQGCYAKELEVSRVVEFWYDQKKLAERAAAQESKEMIIAEVLRLKEERDDKGLAALARELFGIEDLQFVRVLELYAEHAGHLSVSFLQRHLRIGYPRAARLLEAFEDVSFKRMVEENWGNYVRKIHPERELTLKDVAIAVWKDYTPNS